MGIDREKVVQAFGDFEEERFSDSEDTLRDEIKKAVNDHLKDKLGLKKDPIVQAQGDSDDE